MKIAVFFASRNRHRLFKTAYQAVLNNASNPDDVFVALRIDHDDNYINSYIPIVRPKDEIVVGSKTSTSIAYLYEELYNRFNYYDIYVSLNDDMICSTPNWDKQLIEHFSQVPLGIGTVRLGDGYNIHATLFAQTKGWIEALGYMLYMGITGGEDTYLNDLGLALRSAGYEKHYSDMTNIEFRHIHHMFGTRVHDATDHANNILRHDTHRQYLNQLNQIPNDLQKLISAIKGSN